MAAAMATLDAFWLRFLLEDIGLNVATPIVQKEVTRPVLASLIKQIDHRHNFVRERVQRRDIIMEYIETQFQIADIFTKALDAATFIKFRDIHVVPASTLNLVVMKSEESAEKKQKK